MKCKKIKTKHVFMKKIDGKKEYKVKPMLNKKKDTKILAISLTDYKLALKLTD